MTLLNPVFLQIGVALTALVLLGLWSHGGRRRRLAAFLGGRRAVDRLSRSNLYRIRMERMFLLGVGGLAVALASGEPRWSGEAPPPPPEPPAKEIVIALDVSASMQATDMDPTRLALAVDLASELIDAVEDHRVGLLLFAGTGYEVAPPTHDHEALKFLLEGVTPTIASALDPGTLLSVGVTGGLRLLGRGPVDPDSIVAPGPTAPPSSTDPATSLPETPEAPAEGVIVVFGDGETGEPGDFVEEASAYAREAGVTIHAIGIGTSEGGGMIMPEGRYQLGGAIVNESGVRQVSRMEEAALMGLAQQGGGLYAAATDEAGLEQIRRELARPADPPESLIDPAFPFWIRYDLSILLGTLALILILLESLLDMSPFRSASMPARRVS